MACLIASVSAAFACSPLASVTLAVSEAMPGAAVSGTGKGFSSAYGGAPSAEPVVAHLDTRTGVVLWSGKPDLGGSFSFSFPAPNAEPGDHVVMFTQTNADGVPASGTPAKAVLKILAPPITTTTQPATTDTPAPTVTTPPQTAPPAAVPAAPAPSPAPDSPAPDLTTPAATAAPKAVPARAPVTTAAATTTTTAAVAPTAVPVPAVGPATDAAPSPGSGQVALDAKETGFTSPKSDGGSAAPLLLAIIVLASIGASALGIRRFRSRTR